MDKLISELKKVVEHCGKVSPTTCEKGKCKYSEKVNGCIFEAMGMCSPYDWSLEKAEPYMEGDEND